MVLPFGILEQQRRAAGAQHAVGDFGHFQFGVDLDGDALELAHFFKLRDEIAQVAVDHGRGRAQARLRHQSMVSNRVTTLVAPDVVRAMSVAIPASAGVTNPIR